MKKIYFFLVLFLVSNFVLNAQLATIGTGTTASGTTDNGNPIYRSSITSGFGWSLSGHLYTASQLSSIPASSTITSVAFNKTSAFGTAASRNGTINIYARNSSTTTLAATTLGAVQGYTLVYTNATQQIPTTAGWVTFTLSTPIVYNGGSLEFYIDWAVNGASSGLSTGAFLWQYSTGTTQTVGNSNSSVFTLASTLPAVQPARSYNVQLGYTLGAACSGTPTPGNTVSSTASACSAIPFNLSLQNLTAGSGVTYQWQSSVSGAPFSDISGATTSGYSTSLTVATSYQCIVTCAGSSATSTPVAVSLNTPTNCYCASVPSSVDNQGITNVVLENLSNPNISTTTYQDFTASAATANLQQTVSHSIAITLQTGYAYGLVAFIDFNQNGSFADAGERLVIGTSSSANPTTFSGSITIPATALLGNTRMRIIGSDGTQVTNPCYSGTYANTEDYLVNIAAAPTCSPPSGLVATGVTASTATISWNPLTAASAGYQYVVSTTNIPPTAAGTPTTDTFAVLSSLPASTVHYFWVRNNCGSNGFSTWSQANFSTGLINDLCADALALPILAMAADTTGAGLVAEAGTNGSASFPGCSVASSGTFNDVWYKITIPSGNTNTVVIATRAISGSSSSDWVMGVYEACTSTVSVACSDDPGATVNPGNNSMPLVSSCALTPGSTYYIRIYPYGSSTTATAKIYAYFGAACPTPPVNDACVNATDITSVDCASPTTGTTINANTSGFPNTSCGGTFATQNDVFYKFTTGTNDMLKYIKVKNIDTASAKTVHMAVFSGTCATPISLGCLSMIAGTDSLIGSIFVNANTTYFVKIYSTPGLETTFNICLSDSTSDLIVDTASKNICSTQIFREISAVSQNNSNWVRFITPAGGVVAEIKANGNELGDVVVKYFKSSSTTRTEPTSNIVYMGRNISIETELVPTSPVSVRLYFTDEEKAALDAAVPAANDRSDIVCTKFAGGCAGTYPLNANAGTYLTQTGNAGFNTSGHYVELSVASFSNFFLHKGTTPLAIDLQSFTASKISNGALLNWKVSGTSIKNFDILKSSDNKNFQKIGSVSATNGTTNYSFNDANLNNGANYYKLKMLDQNGKTTFSKVAVIFNSAKGFEIVGLIPTITANKTTVTIASAKATQVTLIVTDAIGRVIMNKKIGLQTGNNDIIMDASRFTQGIYQIHAISVDGKSNVMRLIKE